MHIYLDLYRDGSDPTLEIVDATGDLYDVVGADELPRAIAIVREALDSPHYIPGVTVREWMTPNDHPNA